MSSSAGITGIAGMISVPICVANPDQSRAEVGSYCCRVPSQNAPGHSGNPGAATGNPRTPSRHHRRTEQGYKAELPGAVPRAANPILVSVPWPRLAPHAVRPSRRAAGASRPPLSGDGRHLGGPRYEAPAAQTPSHHKTIKHSNSRAARCSDGYMVRSPVRGIRVKPQHPEKLLFEVTLSTPDRHTHPAGFWSRWWR
jgi:hypothetical protein